MLNLDLTSGMILEDLPISLKCNEILGNDKLSLTPRHEKSEAGYDLLHP